ncbi:MAG: hypothetical protein HZA17_11835 [Nitrospirae bacterium]|nr:hypothetical protein [Nitrospirota bacterium]
MANRYNHAAKMAVKKQDRIDAGLISERFPEVSNIVVHMKYYRQGMEPILMVRTVNFSPSGYAYFHMECMTKGCTDGGFDLTKVIAGMIKNRSKSLKGKLVCDGSGKDVTPRHANIEYEISIAFLKKSQITASAVS